jgi:hypothetical protein
MKPHVTLGHGNPHRLHVADISAHHKPLLRRLWRAPEASNMQAKAAYRT